MHIEAICTYVVEFHPLECILAQIRDAEHTVKQLQISSEPSQNSILRFAISDSQRYELIMTFYEFIKRKLNHDLFTKD